jgi:hypothetical protein
VMRGYGSRSGEQAKNRRQNTGKSALHAGLLERKDRRKHWAINRDMLGVP